MTIPWWLWLAWFLAGLAWAAWFIVQEAIAIVNGPGSPDTLSQLVWSLKLPSAVWFLTGGVFLGLVVWLFWAHFPWRV